MCECAGGDIRTGSLPRLFFTLSPVRREPLLTNFKVTVWRLTDSLLCVIFFVGSFDRSWIRPCTIYESIFTLVQVGNSGLPCVGTGGD